MSAGKSLVAIHGLASKPPEATLAKRYLKYLRAGTRFEIPENQFESVYWADLMGYAPDDADRDEYVEGRDNFRPFGALERMILEVRAAARASIRDVIEELVDRAIGRAEQLGSLTSLLGSLADTALKGISAPVYENFLPDMHRYFHGGRREPVRDQLAAALDRIPEDHSVCLIAHSMGSLVALDLILDGCRPIDRFVTIGSPLGISAVQRQLGYVGKAKEELPTRIKSWKNYYDPIDIVAVDSDLRDDFPNMNIIDVRVRNEFITRALDRNHHKSYGYLRNDDLGEYVMDFLQANPT